jgi:hypothetical protein
MRILGSRSSLLAIVTAVVFLIVEVLQEWCGRKVPDKRRMLL